MMDVPAFVLGDKHAVGARGCHESDFRKRRHRR
jgi:hypothetical protein